MNPLTNVRNVAKLNEQDLRNGIFDHKKTWHSQYKDSAYMFIGGMPYDLTEGDILCVFSQYGEVVNINLVRDKKSGKSKGYGFICYEDQRSTILAVDNLNGIKLGGRTIRVDHVTEYRAPKGDEKGEDGRFKDKVELGCAPKTPSPKPSDDEELLEHKQEKKKKKKEKKKRKKKERNSVSEDRERKPKQHFREDETDSRKHSKTNDYSRDNARDKIDSSRNTKTDNGTGKVRGRHDSRSPSGDRVYVKRERSTSKDEKNRGMRRDNTYSPEHRRRRSRSASPDTYRSSKDSHRRRR